jgi:hypothetical protein
MRGFGFLPRSATRAILAGVILAGACYRPSPGHAAERGQPPDPRRAMPSWRSISPEQSRPSWSQPGWIAPMVQSRTAKIR